MNLELQIPIVPGDGGVRIPICFIHSLNNDVETGAVYSIQPDNVGKMYVEERLQEDYPPEADPECHLKDDVIYSQASVSLPPAVFVGAMATIEPFNQASPSLTLWLYGPRMPSAEILVYLPSTTEAIC